MMTLLFVECESPSSLLFVGFHKILIDEGLLINFYIAVVICELIKVIEF